MLCLLHEMIKEKKKYSLPLANREGNVEQAFNFGS